MSTESGKLYSAREVADKLYPNQNASSRTVSKEMSRNGIRAVSGWPADYVDLLVEYRQLSWKFRYQCNFQKWLDLEDTG